MALKAVIDKLEDVDEPIRALYVEKNGKFQIDVEGLDGDPMGLRRALQDQRRKASDLENKVKQWDALGKTPDEILKLTEDWEEYQRTKDKPGDTNDQLEKIKQQMNDKHAAETKKLQDLIAKKETETSSLRKSLEQTMIDNALTAAIAAERGKVRPLLRLAREFVTIQEENGRLVMKIVDEKGTARVNGKGDDLSIPEMIAEMKASDEYASLFEGTGASGSGARPTGGNGAPHQYRKKSDFKSEKERAGFIDKYGLPAYTALPME